jgi:hypothetical protein
MGTTYIADIDLIEVPEGVRVERILSNGQRKLVTSWVAPDHATAWKWGKPLIGCIHYG